MSHLSAVMVVCSGALLRVNERGYGGHSWESGATDKKGRTAAFAVVHTLYCRRNVAGRLRVVGRLGEPANGVPRLDAAGEIGLSAVQRRSASLRLGDFVDVTDIGAEPPEARRLTLEPLAPFSTSDASFELYAQEALVDVRFVCKGAIVSLVFGGENRLFRIAELVSWSPPAEGVALPVCRSTRRTEIKLRTASRPPEAAKDDAVSDDLQVNYASIGGSLDQVAVIRQMVELPLKQPELFSRTFGGTLLARAVAAEAGASVYVVNGAEIISKYYGETEKKLEKRVVATLLTLMDGTSGGGGDVVGDRVVVIAATNRANSLDEALRRPGRFDREVEVGQWRTQQIHLRTLDARLIIPDAPRRPEFHRPSTPNTLSDSDVRDVASKAHGYVGADLAAVCREAGIKAVKKAVLRGKRALAAVWPPSARPGCHVPRS
ncbi:MAG: P-loop containing nucleoside triphosphate hydrolase protein [Olpidium bornovanus]|uniref:P-loop containing nucleoside triphosphate hydrolase protein n=1 Tax=Olpidium bornovanus TaxID=278681 RepID=A0A8H7ZR66_9FUNG|nr:MAG: P-loop containing nucleoside triphosphate hydrolase protein [Olpidium bornovanus]